MTLGTSGVGDTVVLKSIAIVGASGTPSNGSEGVRLNGGQSVILEDVTVYNFDYGYHLMETNSCVVGLGAQLTRIFSGAIRVSHLWFDSWAEAKISQSRFGMNGSGDIAGADYIRVSVAVRILQVDQIPYILKTRNSIMAVEVLPEHFIICLISVLVGLARLMRVSLVSLTFMLKISLMVSSRIALEYSSTLEASEFFL